MTFSTLHSLAELYNCRTEREGWGTDCEKTNVTDITREFEQNSKHVLSYIPAQIINTIVKIILFGN